MVFSARQKYARKPGCVQGKVRVGLQRAADLQQAYPSVGSLPLASDAQQAHAQQQPERAGGYDQWQPAKWQRTHLYLNRQLQVILPVKQVSFTHSESSIYGHCTEVSFNEFTRISEVTRFVRFRTIVLS